MRGGEGALPRPLLAFHPAGVFFALAALMAAVLPWLWLLPLADPRLAHVRLGLFGFGGAAVCGYVMTAQKAWTGRPLPLPALGIGALVLAARLASLCRPEALWPVLLPAPALALAILWPVLRAGRWDKAPLAAVPLMLAAAEALLPVQPGLAGVLPEAMAVLVFLVGGRLVPAFTAEARRRRGLRQSCGLPLWLGAVPLGSCCRASPGPAHCSRLRSGFFATAWTVSGSARPTACSALVISASYPACSLLRPQDRGWCRIWWRSTFLPWRSWDR